MAGAVAWPNTEGNPEGEGNKTLGTKWVKNGGSSAADWDVPVFSFP